MKRFYLLSLLLCVFSFNGLSQEKPMREKYGPTFNLGVGIGGYSGYYRYVGYFVPVVHADVEFDVAKNFTLAPFINFYSYADKYTVHLKNPSRDIVYVYRVHIMPMGVKGTYYFDQLFRAGPDWDFYAAGSLGFVLVRGSSNDPYYVDNGGYTGYYYNHGNQAYLDAHIGAEYHASKRVGLFLDLSNGLSTFGIAIH